MIAEWRLAGPAMRQVVAAGGQIVVVGPPKAPHLPCLKYAGLDERHLVWIKTEAPAERLWVTEQLIKTNVAGLLVSWLPQARQEQIRRLQVCAQACDRPTFLCRPSPHSTSPPPHPLRVELGFGSDWDIHVRLLKRKGPTHEEHIALRSISPRCSRPDRQGRGWARRSTRPVRPHADCRIPPRQPIGLAS
jgi:protein ImuA